jgi:hypothetical protein
MCCLLGSSLISSVNNIILKQTRIMSYFETGREGLDLIIVSCVLKSLIGFLSIYLMIAIVYGSSQHEHDS